MGFLDRLLGREDRSRRPDPARGWSGNASSWRDTTAPSPSAGGYRYGQQSYDVPAGAPGGNGPGGPRSEDELAVERYRYLLRTAPPERIEEVHAEAFARLTPEQRRMVFDELSRTAPAGEAPRSDDARSLAQAATRSEIRQPGTLERTLGGWGPGGAAGPGGYGPGAYGASGYGSGVYGGGYGPGAYGGGYGFGGMGGRGFGGGLGGGFGSTLGASLLGSVAGYVIGSTLMSAFLPEPGAFGEPFDASGAGYDGGDGGDRGDWSDGSGGGDDGSGGDGDGGSGDGGSGGTEAAGWDGGSGTEAAGWDGGGGWDGGSGLDGGGDWGGGFDQDAGGFDV